MADITIIRVAGPYIIGTNGVSVLINGEQAKLHNAIGAGSRDGSPLLFWAEGAIGANGKQDLIGITEADYAIHAAARPAQVFGGMDGEPARFAAERAFDMANNEGGEGFNPHRSDAERTYARGRNVDRRYPQGA